MVMFDMVIYRNLGAKMLMINVSKTFFSSRKLVKIKKKLFPFFLHF